MRRIALTTVAFLSLVAATAAQDATAIVAGASKAMGVDGPELDSLLRRRRRTATSARTTTPTSRGRWPARTTTSARSISPAGVARHRG